MRTKHLLTALALPAVFAACTSEEILTEDNVKENLGNRPVVEDVTFSFADAQSRATIVNWGTINFEESDKLGVALIDVVNTSNATASDPIARYHLLTNSINTNYIFTADASGNFSSEAAMVEGNYVFYYPYNTQRTRNQLLTNLPKEQALTQLADGTYSSYPSVLAYSEENGAPLAVSYDFLSAEDAGNQLEGTLKQIYATPLITIQNGCSVPASSGSGTVPVEMTIKQISLSIEDGSDFVLSAPLKFAASAQDAYAEANGTNNSLVAKFFNETIPAGKVGSTFAGSWNTEIKRRYTSELIGTAVTGGKSSEIVLTLAEPVTVPAEGSFSFYAVIPAEEYGNSANLVATVTNGQGLSAEVTFADATLTAGQRYPEEEINDDNTLNNDIKGMTFTQVVDNFTAQAGVLVSSVDELINAVKNAESGQELDLRVSGTAAINKRVADFLKLTTTGATQINFLNDVTIEGTGVILEPAKTVTFDKATAVSGAAVTLNSANVAGELVIAEGASVTHKNSNLTSIENSGTLAVEGTATAAITNKGALNVDQTAIFNGNVVNGGTGIAAEINVCATKNATFTNLTNESGSDINNLGTIVATALENSGEIVNGSETNFVASLQVTTNNAVSTVVEGKITNYAVATVNANNGEIEMMNVNATLTVTSGTGTVVNDVLALVTDNGSTQTVTYTFSGVQTNETIVPGVLTNNKITKVIFDGVVLNMKNEVDLSSFDLHIKSNSSLNSLTGAGSAATNVLKYKSISYESTNVKLTVNAGTSTQQI